MLRCGTFLLLLGGVWGSALPAHAQQKHAATTPKKQHAAPADRDPNAPPLFALPTFWTPPSAPLTQPLALTRSFTASTDNGGDELPDTVRATFQYVAPGKARDTTRFRLHDPDDRFYGFFRPSQHAHFRLDEQTPSGTLTRYFILHPSPAAGTGWFRTTAATAYPAGHPGRPDGARAGFLDLEYHAACDVQSGRGGSSTKVLLRQPDTGQLTRYE